MSNITRRDAIQRVGLLLGGITLAGSATLLEGALESAHARAARLMESGAGVGPFSAADVALLDEIADTILPPTKTPGAKAAKTGAFIALMVTDTYDAPQQQRFMDGMKTLDAESTKSNGAGFMQSTKAQRLALLQRLDREQKIYSDAREAALKARKSEKAEKTGDKFLPDQRKEQAAAPDANAAPAVTADSPTHYFRMMKELTLLGYFTSEIGYTQAMRYQETPGRFDPCVPYRKGEKAWAPHA